jgi:hypothetical protein
VVTALCDGVVQPYACTSRSHTLLDYAVESATPDTLDLLATMVPPELVATTVSRGMLDPSPRTKRAMETLSAYLDRPVHVEYVGAIVARMEDVHVDVGHLPWLFQLFPEVNADHEVVMAAAPTDKIRASLFVEARWCFLTRDDRLDALHQKHTHVSTYIVHGSTYIVHGSTKIFHVSIVTAKNVVEQTMTWIERKTMTTTQTESAVENGRAV